MKKWIAALLVLVVLIFQFATVMQVQAGLVQANAEVRVGLTSMYSGKEEITIYNTKLGYGYCVGNSYLQEAVLESAKGFSFSPVNGYLVSETVLYGSYEAAKIAAREYASRGIEAYPGSTYQCCWRVYFTSSSSYADAARLKENITLVTGKRGLEILSENEYRVLVEGDFGMLLLDVDEHQAYPQFRPVTVYRNGVNCVNLGSRAYRGRIEIGRYGKELLTAVNIVPLEEYLYGVVPSEMPSSWPMEALKAQAVCSRSYALVKAGYGGASNAKKAYKITDTVSSQVYKGYHSEANKANQAVDATKGEMVCYDNKVVAAYFFSTSGGKTESSEDVWGVELPYLQSVPDRLEYDSSRETWQVTMRLSEISELLSGQDLFLGNVASLTPLSVSSSGRISALKVAASHRSPVLQGTTIRTVLNLYSTKFKIVKKGDVPDKVSVLSANGLSEGRISGMYFVSADGVQKASETLSQYVVQSGDNLWNYPKSAPERTDELLFAGMGYGHGVGMSQYGARGMAEAGFNYKEIIEYYYTGAYVR